MLILHIDDDADDRALFLEAIKRIDISILHLEATDAINGLEVLAGSQVQKRSDFRALISSLKEIFQHVFQHPQDTNDYFNRHWNCFTCSFRA